MSYGRLNLLGFVSGPSEAGGLTEGPSTRTYDGNTYYKGQHGYYGCGGVGSSCNYIYAAYLAKEAILDADAAGVNFANYDNDGDGYVDGVMIFHQGRGKEESGNNTDIWSHRWCLSCAGLTAPVLDGVTVDDYAMQPEMVGTNMISIGTPAHEFGHVLGLPDLYDTDGSTEGIGEHGLMGSCNWLQTGGVAGDTPCHMDPWSKWRLNWLKPRRPVDPFGDPYAIRSHDFPDYATHDFAIQLESNPGGAECGPGATGKYFLVVNRQGTGFDAGLTAKVGTTGLQIWRIEEDRGCSNSAYPNSFVTVMEADNNNSLLSGIRLQSGDFWRSGTQTTFSDSSAPSSRLVDGTVTNTCVNNIGTSGNPMRAGFSETVQTSEGTDAIGCPIARTKKILFYEGHNPAGNWAGATNSIDNPPWALLDLYNLFAHDLYIFQDFELHQKSGTPVTTTILNDCLGSPCGVVVIAAPRASFSSSELTAIGNYVGSSGRVAAFGDSNLFSSEDSDGDSTVNYYDHFNDVMIEATVNWLEAAPDGGLLITGEWGGYANTAGIFGPSNQLANTFGMSFENNTVRHNTLNDGAPWRPLIDSVNTGIAPAGDRVVYASSRVSGGTPLMRTDANGYVLVPQLDGGDGYDGLDVNSSSGVGAPASSPRGGTTRPDRNAGPKLDPNPLSNPTGPTVVATCEGAGCAPSGPFGGDDSLGVFRPSTRVFYKDMNDSGTWNGAPPDDLDGPFGLSTDIPVAGNWPGSPGNNAKIGVVRVVGSSLVWYLDINGNGVWNSGVDQQCSFGASGDKPVVGDWNGDGKDEIGVFRPSTRQWFLDTNGSCSWNSGIDTILGPFGLSTDIPVAGNWPGSPGNNAKIGVVRVVGSSLVWYLDINGNGVWNSGVDQSCTFGASTDIPTPGDWDGNGKDNLGVWRPSTRIHYRDFNESCSWNGTPTDKSLGPFGLSTDIPVVGNWDGAQTNSGQSPEPLWVEESLAAEPLVVEGYGLSANPAREPLTFSVQGQGIAAMQVQIYDLSGRPIFDSGEVAGQQVRWNLLNRRGQRVANGVYLYIVMVRGYDGTILRSEVRKFIVLK
jgi:M6 family metalloprotease-like protein